MAIKGLTTPEVPAISTNMNDYIGANVEALRLLGQVEDAEQVRESLQDDFAALDASGKAGEKYIRLSPDRVSLHSLINVLDSGKSERYDGAEYPETYVYEDLWLPGTTSGSYTAAELGELEQGRFADGWPTHARLAVHNPGNPEEPLLHFLKQPLDRKYAKANEETQQEAFTSAKAVFELEHPDFEMDPIIAKDVGMIALVRRIQGLAMPLEWGFIRDLSLPRKEVGGDSLVGDVGSVRGRLVLNGSDGRRRPGDGVGLSVGPKKLEA